MSPYAIGGKMGWIVRLDEKGRIVIPQEVRIKLNLEIGTILRVSVEDASVVLEKVESGEAPSSISSSSSTNLTELGKFLKA